jgi:hypothetical protein
MKEAHELLSSLTKKESRIYVDLGDDVGYTIKGEGTILFHIESGSSFEAKNVLYVPGMNNNFFLVLVTKDMGFSIMFKKGQVLIRP